LRDGKVRPDWVARKHDDSQLMSISELLLVAQHDSQDGDATSSTMGEEQAGSNSDQSTTTTSFDCLGCGTTLRLHLREFQATYRCPSCRSEYKSVQAQGEPPVFLVVPSSRPNTKSPHEPRSQNRPVPPDVRNALALFLLDNDASFDQVRHAYRELIKQYHPDKVAHLGHELRKVAELKTKEINSAFQILERFFTE
jgi:DnaJ like chaperone protein